MEKARQASRRRRATRRDALRTPPRVDRPQRYRVDWRDRGGSDRRELARMGAETSEQNFFLLFLPASSSLRQHNLFCT